MKRSNTSKAKTRHKTWSEHTLDHTFVGSDYAVMDSFLVSPDSFFEWSAHSEHWIFTWMTLTKSPATCFDLLIVFMRRSDGNSQWAAWMTISVSLMAESSLRHPVLAFEWTKDHDLKCQNRLTLLALRTCSLDTEMVWMRVWLELTRLWISAWESLVDLEKIQSPTYKPDLEKGVDCGVNCKLDWKLVDTLLRELCVHLHWHLSSPAWLSWSSPHLSNTCTPEKNLNLWKGWALEDADQEQQLERISWAHLMDCDEFSSEMTPSLRVSWISQMLELNMLWFSWDA